MPDHDDEREVHALSLMFWNDGHGRERQHRMTRVQARPAERDVAYDGAGTKRQEAKLWDVNLRGTQRINQVRLVMRWGEGALMDLANVVEIPRRLRPYVQHTRQSITNDSGVRPPRTRCATDGLVDRFAGPAPWAGVFVPSTIDYGGGPRATTPKLATRTGAKSLSEPAPTLWDSEIFREDRHRMDKEQQKAAQARESALKNALGQIERAFGQGSIMKMGDEAAAVRVAAIPTGALSLDLALGVGGLPRGRIVEVFGPESSGKTTLLYHVLANAQKMGGICAFIDAEHAMDPAYAKRIGVDIDELLVSQPDHGEQALEIADLLIRSGAVNVVAIDSVAALTPKAELEGAMGDQTVGVQARMMSQAMRKLAGNLNRANTLCVFTNQIREKVGVMFGSPETQPGGRALKFYSSARLDIRRIETLKEGTEAIGNRVRVKVVKNKVAAPFRQAEFDIEYGQGISSEGCILDLGIEHGIVQKSGSFFSYGDERLGQGRNNVKDYLRENPAVAGEIERKIYEALGLEPAGAPLAAVDPAVTGAAPEGPPEKMPAAEGAAAAGAAAGETAAEGAPAKVRGEREERAAKW